MTRPSKREGVALPDRDGASSDRAEAAFAADPRAAGIDRSYEIYDALPLDTLDAWGNLADFLEAAGSASESGPRESQV